VGQNDGSVTLIDTRDMRVRGSIRALTAPVLAVAFSPAGRRLAVAGVGGQAVLTDARPGAATRQLSGLEGAKLSQGIAYSPDGRLVAAGAFFNTGTDGSGFARVWDAQTGRPERLELKIPALSLAFSPDGRLLAGAGLAAGVEVRDVRTGRLVARPQTGDFARSVAFSHDGAVLAVGHYGGSVRLLSAKTWRPIGRTLAGHRARVTSVDFAARGNLLATGSADGTVRLWDASTHVPMGSPFTVEPDAYITARFSPDASYLFAVPQLGRAVRWDLRPESWARQACVVGGRDLTRQEWRDALPKRPFRSVCRRP
jgi:WD40 repeat protein